MHKILIVFGTRPELIKLYPLITEIKKRGLEKQLLILNTCQHKHLLEKYLKLLEVAPDYELDFMRDDQSLASLTARALLQLQELLNELKKKEELPELILAQGDTTTVMVSAMIAFYNKIKFAHLEAGLRTHDFENPFPEEYNRRIASINAWIHFAPTAAARENLLKEGVDPEKIMLVGNTVVDALERIKERIDPVQYQFTDAQLQFLYQQGNVIFITCHRRENHGKNLEAIMHAIGTLAKKYREYHFIWSLHPNPNVKETVLKSELSRLENVYLVPPIDYLDLIALYSKIKLIITDSGGIQEEAPSFGIPVLITRNATERPEALKLGLSSLVGTDSSKIIANFESYIKKSYENRGNPYGDGKAAARVTDFLERLLSPVSAVSN